MYTLFVILIVIAAILMIGIVLIQESKGGGLSSSFANYNQIGGVRKTTDFVESHMGTCPRHGSLQCCMRMGCPHSKHRRFCDGELSDTCHQS